MYEIIQGELKNFMYLCNSKIRVEAYLNALLIVNLIQNVLA